MKWATRSLGASTFCSQWSKQTRGWPRSEFCAKQVRYRLSRSDYLRCSGALNSKPRHHRSTPPRRASWRSAPDAERWDAFCRYLAELPQLDAPALALQELTRDVVYA